MEKGERSIIEIISPYTEVKDKRENKNIYEKFGVKKYLIVCPEGKYVERYCVPTQSMETKKKKQSMGTRK